MAVRKPSPLLCLQHVPRTGGTSLRNWLAASLPPDLIFDCYWSSPGRTVEDLLWLQNLGAPTWRCIFGHFVFGVERVLGRPGSYAIILRDPIERLISQFVFLRSRDPSSPESADPDPERALLAQLVPGNFQYDNLMSRMIAGVGPIAVGDDQLAELAFDHIEEHYVLVATMIDYQSALGSVTDLISDTTELMQTDQLAVLPQENRNPDPDLVTFLRNSPRAIERISATQQPDLRLYDVFAARPRL